MLGQIEQLLAMLMEQRNGGPAPRLPSQGTITPGSYYDMPNQPPMPFRPPMQQGPEPPVAGPIARMLGGR